MIKINTHTGCPQGTTIILKINVRTRSRVLNWSKHLEIAKRHSQRIKTINRFELIYFTNQTNPIATLCYLTIAFPPLSRLINMQKSAVRKRGAQMISSSLSTSR